MHIYMHIVTVCFWYSTCSPMHCSRCVVGTLFGCSLVVHNITGTAICIHNYEILTYIYMPMWRRTRLCHGPMEQFQVNANTYMRCDDDVTTTTSNVPLHSVQSASYRNCIVKSIIINAATVAVMVNIATSKMEKASMWYLDIFYGRAPLSVAINFLVQPASASQCQPEIIRTHFWLVSIRNIGASQLRPTQYSTC